MAKTGKLKMRSILERQLPRFDLRPPVSAVVGLQVDMLSRLNGSAAWNGPARPARSMEDGAQSE